MILHDVAFHGSDRLHHILTRNGIIHAITPNKEELVAEKEDRLYLDGATVLPGFINSHDHLDFNCYPTMGNAIYPSYREWGPAIQSAYAGTIKEVQTIPDSLKVAWGLYKNLLHGFTTVVNHGKKITTSEELISVVQEVDPLHSVGFEKNWKGKLRNPFRKSPVMIHAGEGTDAISAAEIDELTRSNWFRKKIIAIHGVAMTTKQAKHFSGLVWCPASNYFFLGQTAAIRDLKEVVQIVFGTDSTLSSSWHISEHFQLVKQSGMINEEEFLLLLTSTPAKLLDLKDRGTIGVGKKADLLVIKRGTNLFDIDKASILLVIQAGKIRLADVAITGLEPATVLTFSRIKIEGSEKYVEGRPLELAASIKQYYPSFENPFAGENA
jgi:cytosine/adenosine deaminase-related metal-dependent hydrolase